MITTGELKIKINQALKNKDDVAKNIFRLLLGEIQTLESVGKPADPNKIIKKLIESNKETLKTIPNEILSKEIEILSALLPKEATIEEIEKLVEPINQSIKEAKSDGQATGLVFKHLKTFDISFDGKLVNQLVENIRKVNTNENH